MPGPWNDSTDRQLLLTIIHLSAPKLPDWSQVAKLMGDGYTAESTRQHFQKMRKSCKTEFGEPGSGTPAPATKGTPGTPKAAKANVKTPGKSTGKRKGKGGGDAGQDDDEDQSPSKKVKSECESGEGDFDLA
ncbi:hypothetical protein LTR36_009352 [Oleoguttula mirabilis]|uniref:Myb-like domain-containing protein n=1 Tax=Oleoguttula mirabilis TaxID=1507867 RepID=A0AAV9JS38_9PEZI|nr:hypothetical protein LTR36_009352 [Oleoguttula mirabilis]